MEIRVKYTNYDNYEFKSLGEKDLRSALDVFNSFPWEDETRKIENVQEDKTYPIIKFLKGNGEYVEINGFGINGNISYNLKLKYKYRIWRVIIGFGYDKTKTIDFIARYYNNYINDTVDYIKSDKNAYNSAFVDFFNYNFSDKDIIVDIDRNLKREFRYGLKPKKIIGASICSMILLFNVLFFSILYSFNLVIIVIFSTAIPVLS